MAALNQRRLELIEKLRAAGHTADRKVATGASPEIAEISMTYSALLSRSCI
jgi:hypothetical protein